MKIRTAFLTLLILLTTKAFASAQALEETAGSMNDALKTKFIEGNPVFMSIVAITLIVGLTFCIERVIYLALADINSYNIIYNTINNEKKINPRIKDLIKYEYESLKLIGYKDIGSIIECPSYLYLKKINKLNSKTDISFKTTKYQLEDRLRLGIEISYDEYQRVTKYHKELKRKLV